MADDEHSQRDILVFPRGRFGVVSLCRPTGHVVVDYQQEFRLAQERAEMESQVEQLWKILIWGFGLCFTGFVFLAGWMWWLVGQIHKRVTYEWMETKFERDIRKEISDISLSIRDIRNALLGDLATNTKGLLHRVDNIEDTCERHHGSAGTG